MRLNIRLSHDVLTWVLAHAPHNALTDDIVRRLHAWANGETSPTLRQLETISQKLRIPLGYFFLNQPPQEDHSLAECRTIDSMAHETLSRDAYDVIQDMKQRQDFMRECLISEGEAPLPYVGSFRETEDYERLSQKMRDCLGLSIDWYKASKDAHDSFTRLRTAISDAGTLVMVNGVVRNNTHRPLSIDEFRAFALIDEYAPLIFINTNDSKNGQVFSILHEFAHIGFGQNDYFNDRYGSANHVRPIETLCNAIAADVLVPQNPFVHVWNEGFRERDIKATIEDLAIHFKCSRSVIARKAYDNKLINDEDYKRITRIDIDDYNTFKKNKKIDKGGQSGGDYYNTALWKLDLKFLHALVNRVNEGETLYTDAFRLTHTNYATFFKLVDKLEARTHEA